MTLAERIEAPTGFRIPGAAVHDFGFEIRDPGFICTNCAGFGAFVCRDRPSSVSDPLCLRQSHLTWRMVRKRSTRAIISRIALHFPAGSGLFHEAKEESIRSESQAHVL
jgi:hypothetical protein